MRIAGYTAMVLSVPYIGAHVIAGSPSVREWLEGDRPDLEDDCPTGKAIVDLVRTYWGDSEGMPYADRLVMERAEHEGGEGGNGGNENGKGDEKIVDWTVLESDPPHDVRMQQGVIEELKHRPVSVRATLVPPNSIEMELDDNDADGSNTAWRGRVEGTVAANRGDLVTALGGAGWEDAKRDVTQAQSQGGGTASGVGLAAVDFDDDDDGDDATTSADAADGGIRTDAEMDAFESSGYQIASTENEVTHLKRLTTTWSAWHHESSWSGGNNSGGGGKAAQGGSSSSSAARSAPSRAEALQIATLEHRIAQLQADLKDPMCTRSFDDMERELKEARNELWRLRGGWGGKIRSALRL